MYTYVEVGGVSCCLASKRHFSAKLYIVGPGGYPKRSMLMLAHLATSRGRHDITAPHLNSQGKP